MAPWAALTHDAVAPLGGYRRHVGRRGSACSPPNVHSPTSSTPPTPDLDDTDATAIAGAFIGALVRSARAALPLLPRPSGGLHGQGEVPGEDAGQTRDLGDERPSRDLLEQRDLDLARVVPQPPHAGDPAMGEHDR